MRYSYEELAGMIDHSLLQPTMTDQDIQDGCELAKRYQVASVCVKPYAVGQALQILRSSSVAVGNSSSNSSNILMKRGLSVSEQGSSPDRFWSGKSLPNPKRKPPRNSSFSTPYSEKRPRKSGITP